MTFKPKNKEEWEIQKDFVEKHVANGGVPVVDESSGALIRFEYDNPIYSFYKHQYQEIQILMQSLKGFNTSSYSQDAGITPSQSYMDKIKARKYKNE